MIVYYYKNKADFACMHICSRRGFPRDAGLPRGAGLPRDAGLPLAAGTDPCRSGSKG